MSAMAMPLSFPLPARAAAVAWAPAIIHERGARLFTPAPAAAG